jgi:co-chaperonin GroES (HSP10)
MNSENILPETKLQPLEDRLVILPDNAKEFFSKDANLIVPDSYKHKHQPHRGTIVAAGPGKIIGGSIVMVKILQAMIFIAECACKLIPGVSVPEDMKNFKHLAMPLKRGDRVMYGHYAGVEIEDPGSSQKYLVVRLDDVFIILPEEKGAD